MENSPMRVIWCQTSKSRIFEIEKFYGYSSRWSVISRMSWRISSVFSSINFVRSNAFGGSFSSCISSALASTMPTRLFRSWTHFLTLSSSITRQCNTPCRVFIVSCSGSVNLRSRRAPKDVPDASEHCMKSSQTSPIAHRDLQTSDSKGKIPRFLAGGGL